MRQTATHETVSNSLRHAAQALREAGVQFMLGGHLACWARGGPRSQNDVELMVPGALRERAIAALVAAGMSCEEPPEEWLVKIHDGAVTIDLILESLALGPITEQMVEQAEEMLVLAVRMHVCSIEDVLTARLLAVSEQHMDYSGLLEVSRALRELVDWSEVWSRTCESPYARAFFALLDELRIVDRPAASAPEQRSQRPALVRDHSPRERLGTQPRRS